MNVCFINDCFYNNYGRVKSNDLKLELFVGINIGSNNSLDTLKIKWIKLSHTLGYSFITSK